MKRAVGCDDAHELVIPHFMAVHVPKEFFGEKTRIFHVADAHSATQFPQALIVEIGSVGLYVHIDVECRVEAFHEHAFAESP